MIKSCIIIQNWIVLQVRIRQLNQHMTIEEQLFGKLCFVYIGLHSKEYMMGTFGCLNQIFSVSQQQLLYTIVYVAYT